MDPIMSDAYMTLADAFCYPAPGRLDALKQGLAAMPRGAGKDAYAAFLNGIDRLPLGEWEELHTRTLDLNPPAAPYVGYQMWGESYQRGAFLAKMNRALTEAGVEIRRGGIRGITRAGYAVFLKQFQSCRRHVGALKEISTIVYHNPELKSIGLRGAPRIRGRSAEGR